MIFLALAFFIAGLASITVGKSRAVQVAGIVVVLVGAGFLVVTSAYSGQSFGNFPMMDAEASEQTLVQHVLTYLEGAFGALTMVTSGVGALFLGFVAIRRRSFKSLLLSLALFIIAVAFFIARSFVSTFYSCHHML